MRGESLLGHEMEGIRLDSQARVSGRVKDSKETRGAIMLSLVQYVIKSAVWAGEMNVRLLFILHGLHLNVYLSPARWSHFFFYYVLYM